VLHRRRQGPAKSRGWAFEQALPAAAELCSIMLPLSHARQHDGAQAESIASPTPSLARRGRTCTPLSYGHQRGCCSHHARHRITTHAERSHAGGIPECAMPEVHKSMPCRRYHKSMPCRRYTRVCHAGGIQEYAMQEVYKSMPCRRYTRVCHAGGTQECAMQEVHKSMPSTTRCWTLPCAKHKQVMGMRASSHTHTHIHTSKPTLIHARTWHATQACTHTQHSHSRPKQRRASKCCATGAHTQRSRVAHLQQVLHDGQPERERLAAACLRGADDVCAVPRGCRQHCCLDGGGGAETLRTCDTSGAQGANGHAVSGLTRAEGGWVHAYERACLRSGVAVQH